MCAYLADIFQIQPVVQYMTKTHPSAEWSKLLPQATYTLITRRLIELGKYHFLSLSQLSLVLFVRYQTRTARISFK